MKTLKAVIFDFDGIIVSSKTAEFESWRRIYQVFDCNLTISKWIKIISTIDGVYDPALYLFGECLYKNHKAINRKTVRDLQNNLYELLLGHLCTLPGVLDIIKQLKVHKYKLGLASNGDLRKIKYNLKRLKLFDYFDVLVTKEDVENKKPAPDIYLKSLAKLNVKNSEVIVFEDSPQGILAAKTANIYCICIPNKITKHLVLEGADETYNSFKEVSIETIIKHIAACENSISA